MKAAERTAWTKGFEKGMIAGRAINEGAASVKLAAAQAVVRSELIGDPTDRFLHGFRAGVLRIADALGMTDRRDGDAELIAFTRTAVEAEVEAEREACAMIAHDLEKSIILLHGKVTKAAIAAARIAIAIRIRDASNEPVAELEGGGSEDIAYIGEFEHGMCELYEARKGDGEKAVRQLKGGEDDDKD